MAFVDLPTALVTHLLNTAIQTPATGASSQPAANADVASGGSTPTTASAPAAAGGRYDPSVKYPSSNTGGPNDVWQAANAGPWNYFTGGPYAPNAGQQDQFGNVYYPVDNSLWQTQYGGKYVDPGTLPSSSAGLQNAQLWGGGGSDSPPAWLQQIVLDALKMTGDAQKAREAHIMSSLLDPKMGANRHDLGYVERMFGITPSG